MMQQYILLRKENDLLNSLIGQSFNQKSKFEAGKILDEIHSKAESRMIGKKSLCYIVDKNEILGVGGSTLLKDKKGKIISNLILDNFGEWFAGTIRPPQSPQTTYSMRNDVNVLKTIGAYVSDGTNKKTWNHNGGSGVQSLGTRMRVGSGITVPTRQDFKIQTAFGTAPESNYQNTNQSVYNSGLGTVLTNMAIVSGGSGSINESILSGRWIEFGGSPPPISDFVLFRDIISPSASFTVGQTIALEYTIQL